VSSAAGARRATAQLPPPIDFRGASPPHKHKAAAPPPSLLSERELAFLWEGQRFPADALRTVDGRPLRVIYRGRCVGGPGPDYRDALISAPEELLQGDVELHVRSSDFARHGHGCDAAYDRLALHLVFRHDATENSTELASGRRVPIVALGDWVEGRATQIRGWLAQPALWREPCWGAVERMGADGAGAALERLGDIRFRAKATAFARELRKMGSGLAWETALDQLLWRALMEALGYGGERGLLAAIALRLPWREVRATMLALAAGHRAAAAAALLASALERERTAAPTVSRAGLRPGNRAEVRLQGAAALASRFATRGIWASLSPLLKESPQKGAAPLIALVSVPGTVGRGRAIELLANAVLPCASAAGLEREAEAAYQELPLPAHYGAVKHIRRALDGAVPLNSRRQQGMLYLLRNYCSQGGCGRCALS